MAGRSQLKRRDDGGRGRAHWIEREQCSDLEAHPGGDAGWNRKGKDEGNRKR